ncbi:MAG: Cell division protein SepF [Firmicutes bacterium ADurb.Bin456]|nr:MAG: Cell division protein SepF [Firmicutes bacterium ADurb.Bin456]
MAVKLVDKVLSFMGFEEEAVEEEAKSNRVEEPEEQPWHRKRDRVREKEREKGAIVSLPAQRQVRVVVIEPKAYDEVKDIVDNLKNRCPVIVNLEQATPELARRVVDFVMGASYALNGSQQKVGTGIFLFVPSNMDISSELKDQNREKGMFSWMRT